MRYFKLLLPALLVTVSATAFAATDSTTTDVSTTTAPATTDSTSSSATSTTTTTTTQTTNNQEHKYKLGKMTCQEFTVLDESFRPKVVYWAVGHAKGKKADMLSIEGVDRVIPILVEECTAYPEKSFWKTLKEKAKDIF